MSYAIVVGRRAEKALQRRIHPDSAERIREAIATLGEDPYPRSSTKLSGEVGYRLRVGNYRLLYLVDEEQRLVTVTRVGHRQSIYG